MHGDDDDLDPAPPAVRAQWMAARPVVGAPDGIAWRQAQFWHRRGDRVVCCLCPFRCRLKPGEPGLCRVRRATAEGMETATFASAVWHWQSVERKPLYHFRPGLPTLTLAAPGCTFRCGYCQNAVLSQFGKEPASAWRAQPLDPSAAVAAALHADAAIAISYTEPTLSAELTLELARQAAGRVPLVWKSNGFITRDALERIGPLLQAVNIDLKAADDATHRRLTGAPLGPVLEAAAAFKSLGVWVEVSTPLVEGVHTGTDTIRRLAEQVAGLGTDTPWHLVRVLPEYRMPGIPPTSPTLLAQARTIGESVGLRHIYVERALGPSGRATCCPGCGAQVIGRGIGRLEENRLVNGGCPQCGAPISGVW